MTSYFATFFAQLLGHLPLLLVYIGGLVVCMVMWRRASTAAMLAAAGLAIMLLMTVANVFVTNYLMFNRAAANASQMGSTILLVSIGFTVTRAFGLALVIAAVFAQRSRLEERGFEVNMVNDRFNRPQ